MRGSKLVPGLLVCALLLTACGARLTDDQRELAVAGGATGAGASAGTGGAATPSDGDGADGGSGGQAVPGAGGSATTSGGGQSDGADDAGGSGGGQGGASEAGGAGDSGDGSGGDGDAAWRQVPEGGNGGATDVGVTEESITLANVSDVSGAVPGMFEDAQLGAAAYLAYHNATQGPIYGRTLELLPLDSRMDSTANRQQYLRACDEALAAVGSMSAFEEGAADPVSSCGIPDLRSAATSQPMQKIDAVYSVLTQEPGVVVSAEYQYWKDQHPDAIKDAGYLVLDNQTTRFQTEQNRKATRKLGYEWDYVEHVQVAETNYSGFVLDLIDQGIEFLTFQGDYSQAVRLAQAMRQQDYWPEVFALQTNTYTPDFIASGGAAVEDTEIALATQPLEEMGANEEMQRYAEWLGQVDPSAQPTSSGMMAWSGAKLMVELLKDVGPEVTRDKVLDALSGVEGWTGGGLHAPQDIGPKRLTSCTVIVKVQNGEFVRTHPDEGYRCEEPVSIS